MPDQPETPNQLQAYYTFLATAERCRRLAASITDRVTCMRLLQMADECEGRAAELRTQSEGRTK